LGTLGFDSVDGVRAGKFIEITLDESDREVAEKQVTEMCEKLLANPVIERYNFDLKPA
jgi:phosphoribosylformylglycinamidine synthase